MRVDRDGETVVAEAFGLSFRSGRDRRGAFTHTVIGNTTDGAWPLARLLGDRLGGQISSSDATVATP